MQATYLNYLKQYGSRDKALEMMANGEHFACTHVEWDPTGRYVTTSVSYWSYQVAFWGKECWGRGINGALTAVSLPWPGLSAWAFLPWPLRSSRLGTKSGTSAAGRSTSCRRKSFTCSCGARARRRS